MFSSQWHINHISRLTLFPNHSNMCTVFCTFFHTLGSSSDEPKFLKSSTFLITSHCSPTLKLWPPIFTHVFCLAADNTHSSTLYISCYLLPARSTDHSVICRHHSLWTFKSAIITTNKRGLELILDADPPSP